MALGAPILKHFRVYKTLVKTLIETSVNISNEINSSDVY